MIKSQRVMIHKINNKIITDSDEPEFAEQEELDLFIQPIQKVLQQRINEEAQNDCTNLQIVINESLHRLKYLREDKQYYSAYDYVMKFYNSTLKTQKDHLKSICAKAQVDNYQLKSDIIDDYEEIQKIRTWFQLKSIINNQNLLADWIVESSVKNYLVRYQILSGTSVIVGRIDTEINMPLTVFLGLIYEIDLYTTWFPFCEEMKTIVESISITNSQVDKATKILRQKLNIPMLSNREMIVKGWGVNNMDHEGKLYVLVRSIDQDSEYLKKMNLVLQHNPKVVRGFVHIFSFEIEPISINKHRVTVLSSFDLKLKGVPDFIPNFVVRKFAGQLFKKLIRIGNNYQGSQWEKNQKDSPQFYEWMHQSVSNHFAKNQQIQIQL